MKDTFLAIASHELRTPLTPALLAATALERDPRTDAALRDSLAIIRRNIEIEPRLIDDLLDLTRAPRGALRVRSGCTVHAASTLAAARAAAAGSDQDTERSGAAGFARHVTKPVSFDELKRVLAEVADMHPARATTQRGSA